MFLLATLSYGRADWVIIHIILVCEISRILLHDFFRFNGHVSLRSLIQSRGSASRAVGCQFVTICKSDLEVENLKKMNKCEQSMLEVIKDMAVATHGLSSVPQTCARRNVILRNMCDASYGTSMLKNHLIFQFCAL